MAKKKSWFKNLKKIKWLKWLGLGLVVGGVVLGLSVKTYLASLNEKEVLIAQVSSSAAVEYSKDGQVRVYYDDLDGYYPRGSDLFVNNTIYDLNDGRPQAVDSIQVKAGDSITTRLWDHDRIYYLGSKEAVNNTCGSKSVKAQVAGVEASGEPIEAVQCWNDQNGRNYDDALLILSYKPGTTSEGDGGDDDGNDGNDDYDDNRNDGNDDYNDNDDDGDETRWVVRKYLDANRDGIRETGEAATNREWQFEYRVNGGRKKIYSIEPGNELGDEVMANKGDKIWVHELGQADWLNTTGATKEMVLDEEKLYYFNFGGWPVNGVVPTTTGRSFAGRQPDTGTPTMLTLGALGLGVGLVYVKLKQKNKNKK